ncbi:sensor histidine kinase [Agathobaculum sp. Marseille-P7918]|uniref:sensor histidine kinase n=1 Tax=Agathobaculum sp. Marseille-P7918 TaxID=2479843 RepID=UPI000F641F5B|nr:HAMP domain-containing sensor histidine kinase [Agathobaculum sp. Marseille-P7918]
MCDRQVRQFVMFLLLFAALLLAVGMMLGTAYSHAARALYLTRSAEIASALLEQGVSESVVATALQSDSTTQEGTHLLDLLGMTEQTPAALLPTLGAFRWMMNGAVLAVCAALVCFLFVGTLCFLRTRRAQYDRAAQIVRRYLDGDFSIWLPQNREGSLFQLFAAVEQLATVLQAKQQAERQAKEQLKTTISDISHQLKTPLAAMMMYQEILADEPENTAVVREFAVKMGASLRRMEGLIQMLLKIARLDAGSVRFVRQEVTVAALVQRAVQDLTTRAQCEGKTIRMEGELAQRFACDPAWTAEAVGNLVKNALDHTEQGGSVCVSWSCTPVLLQIKVEDDGCGIAPEDIHHIFKRFYRSERTLDTPGVGLGLPLAKAITEGQGGLLSVQSEPGQGAAFTISFPLTQS